MISIEDIKKIERLAKLNYSEDKLENLAIDMNKIINMIDDFKEIDCSDIVPLRSVLDMKQRLEADEAVEQKIENQLFSNLPKSGSELAKEVNCFVVPKVVE